MSDVNPYQPPKSDDEDSQSLLPRIYWSRKDIPGLSDLAPVDARRLWWKVLPAALKRWPAWIAVLLFLTMPLVAFTTIRILPTSVAFCIVLLFGGSIGMILNQTVIRCALPFIQAERERLASDNVTEESA